MTKIEKRRAYHRAYAKLYSRTPEGKAILKANQKRYYTSAHGKAARLAYSRTRKYKETKARYYHSPKGRANYLRGQSKYRQTAHGRFMLARKMALYKGKEWTLTEVNYGMFMEKPCWYCGGPLNPTGIGLDRLNNQKGYYSLNVVPCCSICNRARGNWWTPDGLRAAVTAVAVFRNKSNNIISAHSVSNNAAMPGAISLHNSL